MSKTKQMESLGNCKQILCFSSKQSLIHAVTFSANRSLNPKPELFNAIATSFRSMLHATKRSERSNHSHLMASLTYSSLRHAVVKSLPRKMRKTSCKKYAKLHLKVSVEKVELTATADRSLENIRITTHATDLKFLGDYKIKRIGHLPLTKSNTLV